MTIGPDESPQRTVLLVAGVVVLLLTAGAWYAGSANKQVLLTRVTEQNSFSESSQPSTSSLPPDTTDQLSVIIQETASSPKPSGTKTYAVSMPPTTTPLVGVEMTLTVSNATSVTTKSRSFTVSENLKETGWKSMANTTNSASQSYSSDSDSEVKNSRSTSTTIGLSFLNLGTEGWLSTEPLELGTITIAPVDVKTAPQFTLTHKSSSAFTKDGKTLPLHLVVAPKMTE